jgi:hypothetical protein
MAVQKHDWPAVRFTPFPSSTVKLTGKSAREVDLIDTRSVPGRQQEGLTSRSARDSVEVIAGADSILPVPASDVCRCLLVSGCPHRSEVPACLMVG